MSSFFDGLFHLRRGAWEMLASVLIAAGVVMAIAGVKKIKNVLAKLKLTQSSKTFNFTKKRQE